MNILLVITKGEIGGAQMFVATLAKQLQQQGYRVTVGYGEGEWLQNTLTPEGVSIVRFNWLKRTKNPFANLYFGWELRRFLDKHTFDVIHFNSSNALFGAIEARFIKPRPKTVFTIHGLSLIDPNYKAPRLMKWLYFMIFKFLLGLIDEPVFVSKNNFAYAKKIRLIHRGTIIRNGIDEAALRFLPRGEARDALAAIAQTDLDNAYIVGSIGRLAYPKNYEFLIETFPKILREIPNAIAIIIGEGPEQARYKQLIRQYNLERRVFLVGKINDASRYMPAFDVFVLPSEYEGMSMTLIEAMFAELPILASRVGGTPELLANDAWTYAFDDKAEFITKLKKIHSQKDFRYSEAQRNHRAQFDGKTMTQRYIQIYG